MVGLNICPKMYLKNVESVTVNELGNAMHHLLGRLTSSQSAVFSIYRPDHSENDYEEGNHQSSNKEWYDLSSNA